MSLANLEYIKNHVKLIDILVKKKWYKEALETVEELSHFVQRYSEFEKQFGNSLLKIETDIREKIEKQKEKGFFESLFTFQSRKRKTKRRTRKSKKLKRKIKTFK